MHGLMRSIGLKYISSKRELETLLSEVTQNPDEQRVVAVSAEGENIVEFRKYLGKGIGVILHGYYNEDNEFVREYYFPFIDGGYYNEKEEVTLNRHIGKTSFAGTCEDARIGVSMIFYLQNGIEFINYLLDKKHSVICGSLSLVGLAASGTILLPVNKSAKQVHMNRMARQNRRELLNAAKQGDEAAIENLTIEDLDLYSQISRRIRKEDVFTIVDNTFMPYGVECDHYMVMGDIEELEEIINIYSQERIYRMTVDCNDVKLSITVNKEDLVGEPMIGRRFKGGIWLQGIIDFDSISKK